MGPGNDAKSFKIQESFIKSYLEDEGFTRYEAKFECSTCGDKCVLESTGIDLNSIYPHKCPWGSVANWCLKKVDDQFVENLIEKYIAPKRL